MESATTVGHLISVITENIGLKYPNVNVYIRYYFFKVYVYGVIKNTTKDGVHGRFILTKFIRVFLCLL